MSPEQMNGSEKPLKNDADIATGDGIYAVEIMVIFHGS
jgi:hypothetical protein